MSAGTLEQIRALADQAATDLKVDVYTDGEETRGVDLGASLDEPQGADALCAVAFSAAKTHDLIVFDPQLGRTVMRGDQEAIAAQFHQGSAFSLAMPISPHSEEGGSLSATTRLWLLIGGAVVIALLLARALTCAAS